MYKNIPIFQPKKQENIKVFNISDINIYITKEIEAYVSIRKQYLKMAKEAREEFLSSFDTLFKSMDDVYLNFMNVTNNIYISKYRDITITDVVNKDFSFIDANSFENEFLNKYSSYENDFLDAMDLYLQLTLDRKNYEDYRSKREKNHIIGGGFGVQGAAQGMLIAAGINLGYDILEAFGEGIYRLSHTMEKDKLYSSIGIRTKLANALYKQILVMHLAYIDIDNFSSKKSQYNYPSQNNIQSAKKIFSNLKSGLITSDKRKRSLAKAIKLNPYNIEFYEYWLENFGDRKNELSIISSYFLDEDLKERKIRILEKNGTTDNVSQLCDFISLDPTLGHQIVNNQNKSDFDSALHVLEARHGDKTHDPEFIMINLEKFTYSKTDEGKDFIKKYSKFKKEKSDELSKSLDATMFTFGLLFPLIIPRFLNRRYGLIHKTLGLIWAVLGICFFLGATLDSELDKILIFLFNLIFILSWALIGYGVGALIESIFFGIARSKPQENLRVD